MTRYMKRLGRHLGMFAAAAALVFGSLSAAPVRAWAAEEPAFAVIDTNGNETPYVNKSEAQKAMKDGYTFKLLKDYSGEWGIKPNNKARDIIVDLNGFDVTCTKADQSNGYAVSVQAAYGGARDCTVTVKNGGSEQSVLTSSYAQIRTGSGDSKFTQVVKIEGDIAFKDLTDGEEALGIELGSGAKLLDTPSARPLVPNGGFSVKETDGANYLYGSLANAAGRSADGVVTMVNDYTGSDPIYSGSKNVTLDLAGHTYTFSGADAAIDVNHPNVVLTVKNGAVTAGKADGAKLIGAPNQATMNNRGLVLESVTLTASGEGVYGISTNGSEVGNTITLKNSTLDIPNGYGIYCPSTGTVSISDSVIKAKHAGVQMCAGSLSIAGNSSITVTGQPQEKTDVDGPIADGAAISIVKREGYKDLGAVEVTGGEFASASGVDSLKAYSFNNNDKVEAEWSGAKDVIAVSGGTYSDVSALPFAGDRVALKSDRGFAVMAEKQALESGAVASVTLDDGSTVYFLTADEAEDFVSADGNLDEGSIKPVTYTVSFDLNGGSGPAEEQVVGAGKVAVEPRVPVREGYEFLGWFAAGEEEPYDFASPVIADLALTAKWVKVWNVTFVYGNGTADDTVVVRDGDAIARPNDPLAEGWKFVGWFTERNEDDTMDPESEYDFAKPVTSDLVLYGAWIEIDTEQDVPGTTVPPTDKPASKPSSGLPQTGDVSGLVPVLAGIMGSMAFGAGCFATKRRTR